MLKAEGFLGLIDPLVPAPPIRLFHFIYTCHVFPPDFEGTQRIAVDGLFHLLASTILFSAIICASFEAFIPEY